MSIHGVKAHEKEENDFSSKLSETCATSSKLRKSIRPVPRRRRRAHRRPKLFQLIWLILVASSILGDYSLLFFSFLIRHCFCLLIAVRGFFAPLIVRIPKKTLVHSTAECLKNFEQHTIVLRLKSCQKCCFFGKTDFLMVGSVFFFEFPNRKYFPHIGRF